MHSQEKMTMYQISILKEETDAWLIDNCLEYIEFIFSIKISLIFSTFLRALELYYPANDLSFSKKIFFGCYCIIIIVRGDQFSWVSWVPTEVYTSIYLIRIHLRKRTTKYQRNYVPTNKENFGFPRTMTPTNNMIPQ